MPCTQVFYGFYTRVAIIDRSTHELASWARDEAGTLEEVPDPLAEAKRCATTRCSSARSCSPAACGR